MSKSKRSPDVDREKEAENHNHKGRREQKKLQAELARTLNDDESLEELYDEDIPQFQKIKRVK